MKQNDFNFNGHFNKTPDAIYHDHRVSMQAFGLYFMILKYYLIPEFKLHKGMIMKQFPNGATAFNRAWKELTELGYLRTIEKRVNGRYFYEHQLFPNPNHGSSEDAPGKVCDPDPEKRSDTAAAQPKNKKTQQNISKPVLSSGEDAEKPVHSKQVQMREKQNSKADLQQMSGRSDHSAKTKDALQDIRASQEESAGRSIGTMDLSRSSRQTPSARPVCLNDRDIPKPMADWVSFKKVGDQIDYAALAKSEGEKFAKEIVYLMQDVYNAPDKKRFKIGGVLVPSAAVKERFMELDYEQVQAVLFHFKQNATPIRNMHAYLLTSLYNEPSTHYHGIYNEVSCVDFVFYESEEKIKKPSLTHNENPMVMEEVNLDLYESDTA